MGNKNILIISEQRDYVTEKIASWIFKSCLGKINIKRINFETKIDKVFIKIPDTCNIEFQNQIINLNEVDFVLYRRGIFNFTNNDLYKSDAKIFYQYLDFEANIINRYLFELIKEKSLSSYYDEEIPKISLLTLAKKNNLDIPMTILTDTKKDLENFFLSNKGEIITKAVQKGGMLLSGNMVGGAGTIKLSKRYLNKMTNNFFPSLFQKEIKKDYDIRTFYLDGAFFSMAIFSQNNKKTKVDLRNYDFIKPNRTVPYKLPLIIENNLKNLFKDLKLKTGSADFIKGIDGIYYFLEINPIGQFTQVSQPCNYQLEKKVAEYTINKIYENEIYK